MIRSRSILKHVWQVAAVVTLVILAAALLAGPTAAQSTIKLSGLALSVGGVGGVGAHPVTLTQQTSDHTTGFDEDVTSYEAYVGNYVDGFTVTPMTAVAGDPPVTLLASVTVDSGSESPSIPLSEGENTITVAVSGGETYTVTVTRHPNSTDFVTIWRTTSDGQGITIPVRTVNLTYNYNVKWGDGSNDTGQLTHVRTPRTLKT